MTGLHCINEMNTQLSAHTQQGAKESYNNIAGYWKSCIDVALMSKSIQMYALLLHFDWLNDSSLFL